LIALIQSLDSKGVKVPEEFQEEFLGVPDLKKGVAVG